MKKFVFAALAAGAIFSAMAQQGVGSVSEVNGLVTITQGDKLEKAVKSFQIKDGAQIVSTATGNVSMQINGCDITLSQNQALKVDKNASCGQLYAAIQNVEVPANFGAEGSGVTGTSLAIGGGIFVTGLILANRKASPN